jgi:hypothetical protein
MFLKDVYPSATHFLPSQRVAKQAKKKSVTVETIPPIKGGADLV